MAIGRTFEESLQKAIRQVDPNFAGFDAYWKPEDMHAALTQNNDRRLFAIAHAMLNLGYTVDQLHDLTKIDRWYLYKLENIVTMYKRIQTTPFEQWDEALVRDAKKTGFSDLHIAQLSKRTEDEVRSLHSCSSLADHRRSELFENPSASLPSSSVSIPLLQNSQHTPTISTRLTTRRLTISHSTTTVPWSLDLVSTVSDPLSNLTGVPSLALVRSALLATRPS